MAETQAERARALVRGLREAFGRMEARQVRALREVLDEAQNDPPGGMRDGSLDESEWNDMKHVADVFDALMTGVELAQLGARSIRIRRPHNG